MSDAEYPESEHEDAEALRQELKALFTPPGGAPPDDCSHCSAGVARWIAKLKWRVRIRAASVARPEYSAASVLSFFYGRFRAYQHPAPPVLGALSINSGRTR